MNDRIQDALQQASGQLEALETDASRALRRLEQRSKHGAVGSLYRTLARGAKGKIGALLWSWRRGARSDLRAAERGRLVALQAEWDTRSLSLNLNLTWP